MNRESISKCLHALAAFFLCFHADASGVETISFQRDIRPLLAENCLRCHGFDKASRQSDLRLDTLDGASQPTKSGSAAIVPYQPDDSELIKRVTSADGDLRMPPPDAGKALSTTQIDLLRRWIGAGASYSKHWSFERPHSQSVPSVRQNAWPHNLIDAFVMDRLEKEGLHPNEEALPANLLRRISLDLIGLPPTVEELEKFLLASAKDPIGAYLAEVDRLLGSPRFGERMAIDWLDAARYADTNGYFGDRARQAWPWRDWVIDGFNNLPFDQFTIEQLAGDLLPEATRSQRVASGFHRNSMANNETGIIDEEYRVEAVVDRVDTTATVWLGLTVGCALCHDHKYDPISQREYYQLFAYFNSSVENGLATKDDPVPTLEVPSQEQQIALRLLRQRREDAESIYKSVAASLDAYQSAWEPLAVREFALPPGDALFAWDFERPMSELKIIGTTLPREPGVRGEAAKFDATQHVEVLSNFDADRPWTIAVWLKPTGSLNGVWSKIDPTDPRRGIEMLWQKGRLQINLVHRWGVDEIAVTTQDAMSKGPWQHVAVSYDGSRRASGLQVFVDGVQAIVSVQRDTLSGSLHCEAPLRVGRRDAGLGYYGLLDELHVVQRASAPADVAGWSLGERITGILARPKESRSVDDQAILRDYYVSHHANPEVRSAFEALQLAKRAESEARAAIPTTLVMQDRSQPRKTHVLLRGQYDQPGEEVSAGVPEVLAAVLPACAVNTPPNRLQLARWLVSSENPLTARVAVNRLWQMCFGEGLVRTPNDFGTQGELPTHSELLDELAVQFIDGGWDIKAMLRRMVTSATYRQSSRASTEKQNRDPDNRLLARGPRFRLPAELIRDQALAVAELLSHRLGGPSAMPYQPEGLWESVSYNGEESYSVDLGEGRWRRSLYTYRKRQSPPPALLIFDANTREKCLVRRSKTNTPLQALVTLNDATYVEASRALAASALAGRKLPSESEDRHVLSALFRQVVARAPEPAELRVLSDLLARQRRAFLADPQAVQRLLRVGASFSLEGPDPVELAAWTLVAQTILNLDEVITRR